MFRRHVPQELLIAGVICIGRTAHSPGAPSDVPPLPPDREPPDIIILPPQSPPPDIPEKLPPAVPPPPLPERPQVPPRIACTPRGSDL